MYKNTRFACVLSIFGAAALLGGCATSVPKAQYNKALPTQYHLHGDDKIQVDAVSAALTGQEEVSASAAKGK
jgi:hypothetical protein